MPGTQSRHTLHLLLLLFGVLSLIALLYYGGIGVAVALAILLAYFFNPVLTWMEFRGVNRTLASLFVLFVLMGGCALFWYIVSPLAAAELQTMSAGNMSTQAHKAIDAVQKFVDAHINSYGVGQIDVAAELRRVKAGFAEKIPAFLLEGSISFAISMVMTPFLLFFFMKDGPEIKRYFMRLVPNRYFEFAMDLVHKMDLQLGNYLRGQFLDALVFGLLATLALWIIGVPYFVFIGLFAGLANLIPFVGPIVGAGAAAASVVIEQGDIGRVGTVALTFVILKVVDDFFVQPLAVGKSVDLHPVAVALGILVADHFFGMIGMLLIVPAMGFFKVVLDESMQTFRNYRFD